ncbi:MAG: hypothetical protein WBA88_05370 [Pseudaminobacter sp.]
MLGFGAVGEFPLASFDERLETWLSLPAVEISYVPYQVGIRAGRNLDLTSTDILVGSPAALVVSGKSFGLPSIDVTFVETAPGFVGGRHVNLPASEIALDYDAIGLRAGKNVNLTAPEIVVSLPSIGIQPGKWIGLPAIDTLFDARLIIPSPGKYLNLPPLNVVSSYGTFRIETGRIFNLANTFSVTTDGGALCDGALGEFALGEGDQLTQEFSRPVLFQFSLFAAGLQAGRNINLSAPDISFNAPVPEVAARHRKLRVHAIAS